jgi:hypothetical protein
MKPIHRTRVNISDKPNITGSNCLYCNKPIPPEAFRGYYAYQKHMHRKCARKARHTIERIECRRRLHERATRRSGKAVSTDD